MKRPPIDDDEDIAFCLTTGRRVPPASDRPSNVIPFPRAFTKPVPVADDDDFDPDLEDI
jgi:hypothetical protein